MIQTLKLNDKDTLVNSGEFSKLSAIEHMTILKLCHEKDKAIISVENGKNGLIHFHLDVVSCRKLVEELGKVLIHLEDKRLADQGQNSSSSRQTVI